MRYLEEDIEERLRVGDLKILQEFHGVDLEVVAPHEGEAVGAAHERESAQAEHELKEDLRPAEGWHRSGGYGLGEQGRRASAASRESKAV